MTLRIAIYDLACEWLRGDDLSDESLQKLNIKRSIDSEESAWQIFSNLGRISTETQPIVLCFDQIDQVALPPHGYIGLQPLFSTNTTIHNDKIPNFLIIISLVTNTWRANKKQILDSDKDRLSQEIFLKSINLDQAEALWKKHLFYLHQQANPKPSSPIYPLTRQDLEKTFENGKTDPRYALKLGQRLIQRYKLGQDVPLDSSASFNLIWIKEFKKTQKKIERIRQLSSPELIQMLREVFSVLEVQEIYSNFLPSSTFRTYSFSYKEDKTKVGIVWSEDANLKNFYWLMESCKKALDHKLSQRLIFIRSEKIAASKNKGYILYKNIFIDSVHRLIVPDLESVHYLATYHSLVLAASAGELVVGEQTPNLQALETLIRNSKILENCKLLQQLGYFSSVGEQVSMKPLQKIKAFTLNYIKVHGMLARETLINRVIDEFQIAQVAKADVEDIIAELVQEKQVRIQGNAKQPNSHFVCLNIQQQMTL